MWSSGLILLRFLSCSFFIIVNALVALNQSWRAAVARPRNGESRWPWHTIHHVFFWPSSHHVVVLCKSPALFKLVFNNVSKDHLLLIQCYYRRGHFSWWTTPPLSPLAKGYLLDYTFAFLTTGWCPEYISPTAEEDWWRKCPARRTSDGDLSGNKRKRKDMQAHRVNMGISSRV